MTKSRIMYMEPKGIRRHTDSAPGRLGRVTFSKTGRTLYYRGTTFTRRQGFCGNYVDKRTREEYWTQIRGMPRRKGETIIRCAGKHGGKQ